MKTLIYVRASTKEQDAERALNDLVVFSKNYTEQYKPFIENCSGTKLNRPVLNQLLNEAEPDDILLVESVDRLSRLEQKDFDTLKQQIKAKGLRLIIADLPTTHTVISNGITGDIMNVINSMLIDLLATMARLDNEKRKERIKQGLERSGYKPSGKSKDQDKWKLIQTLLGSGNYTKQEIALKAGCAVSMVYRVQKEVTSQ